MLQQIDRVYEKINEEVLNGKYHNRYNNDIFREELKQRIMLDLPGFDVDCGDTINTNLVVDNNCCVKTSY